LVRTGVLAVRRAPPDAVDAESRVDLIVLILVVAGALFKPGG
jgi:hypothetical protein